MFPFLLLSTSLALSVGPGADGPANPPGPAPGGAVQAAPVASHPSGPARAFVAEINGDTLPDKLLVRTDGSLEIAINTGAGRFDSVHQHLPAVDATDVLATDLDGDQRVDLYVVAASANVALLGDGTGRFTVATDALGLADGGAGVSAERIDLDGAGREDLLLRNDGGDVMFFATPTGFLRDPDSPDVAGAPAATTSGMAELVQVLLGGAPIPAGLGDDLAMSLSIDDAGRPVISVTSAPLGDAPGDDSSALVLGPTLDGPDDDRGGPALGGGDAGKLPAPPLSLLPSILDQLAERFVDDGMNEVDGATDIVNESITGNDIQDISLTGPDVSTKLGTVYFKGEGADVGIGTSVPITDLQIVGEKSSEVSGLMISPHEDFEGEATAYVNLAADPLGQTPGVRMAYNGGDGKLRFETSSGDGSASSGDPLLTINRPLQRVGIGVDSPGTALDVDGTARATRLHAVDGELYLYDTSFSSLFPASFLFPEGRLELGNPNNAASDGHILLYNGLGPAGVEIYGDGRIYADEVTTTVVEADNVQTVVIDVAGDADVGSLDVRSTSSVASARLFPSTSNGESYVSLLENSAGSVGMRMEYDGNDNEFQIFGRTNLVNLIGPHMTIKRDNPSRVGIGNTEPTGTLHVNGAGLGTSGATVIADNTATASGIALLAQTNGTNGTVVITQNGSGSLVRGFNGGANPVFEVKNSGRCVTTALEITGGGDLVEPFESVSELTPGTVVVIDVDNPGQLATATSAYDRKVAGVVSGAGGVNPGLLLSQHGVLDGDVLLAMTGRVYVRCSAENGAIEPGDLLVSSALPGHAMRATDAERSFGAVVGKALGTLEQGTGLVLVLVNLQ